MVPGITRKFAEEYCQTNGFGFCKIIGKFIASIECKFDNPWEDIGNRNDYDCGEN